MNVSGIPSPQQTATPANSAGALSTIVELLHGSDDLDVKDRSRSVMEQFSVFGNGLALGETAANMELSEDATEVEF